MDQLSIPEGVPKTPLVPPQLHIQVQCLRFLRNPLLPQKPLTVECLEALLQMQKTDPFCKCISRRLLSGKAPHHEFDTFAHVKGLLYKHIMDAGKKFLALVIAKSWKWNLRTNWVTKVIHAHIVSSNANTIGKDEQGH